MSEEFLSGEKNTFEKFYELNIEKYKANSTLAASHPYASSWFTWPLLIRPVFYWTGGEANIYLLGNPVLWWLSTLAVFAFIPLLYFMKLWHDKTALLLFTGYLITFLPFAFIGRVMFLYHYLTPLIFAVMLLSYLASKFRHAGWILSVLLLVIVLSFIYFAPLTYGLPLKEEQLQSRLWLDSWR